MSSKRVFGRFISIAVCVHIKIYTGLSAPLSVVCAGLSCSYDNTKKIDEVKTINAFGMWTNTKNFFVRICLKYKEVEKKTVHAIKISTYCRSTVDSCKSRVATDCVYHCLQWQVPISFFFKTHSFIRNLFYFQFTMNFFFI